MKSLAEKEGALIYALIMTQQVCVVCGVPNVKQSHKTFDFEGTIGTRRKKKTELLINCFVVFSVFVQQHFTMDRVFSGLLLNAICSVSGLCSVSLPYAMIVILI